MSLVKSLNSGVSALKGFQTKMDTIGNNISNVDTTGFKASEVSFEELMNENIGGAGGSESAPSMSNQVGLGVRVASVERDFNQGTIENTGKATDLAIEGDGFFVVNDGAQDLMTRAGNFTFNKDGNLVDSAGNFVQGYNANQSGNIVAGGSNQNVQVDFENALQPQKTQEVMLGGNLNANTSQSQIVQAQSAFTDGSGNLATGAMDVNNLSQMSGLADGDEIDLEVTNNDGSTQTITYTYGGTSGDGATVNNMIDAFNNGGVAGGAGLDTEGQISLVDGMFVLSSNQMGDSDLNIDNLSVSTGGGSISAPDFQVVQEGETGTQSMSTTIYDGLGQEHTLMLDFEQTDVNQWDYTASFAGGETISSGGTGTINFDSTGQMSSGGSSTIDFDPGSGASAMSFDMNLGSSDGTSFTQYSGSNTAKVLSQDGYTQGSLVDVRINGGGRVQGVYDNGENKDLAQIALADVENEGGLEMMQGGLFRANSAAGQVSVNSAQEMANSSITSGALEGSNVDLAQEFTEMITAQRAYQSSARVITTSDEMLTEAVNLKR